MYVGVDEYLQKKSINEICIYSVYFRTYNMIYRFIVGINGQDSEYTLENLQRESSKFIFRNKIGKNKKNVTNQKINKRMIKKK